MSRVLIKDYYWETRLFNARVLTALVLIGALFLLLTGRLVYLQVLSHDLYTTLSQNNSVRIEPLAPTRGLIYDRRGNVLAENIPSFSLEIIPEQIENLDLTLGELRTLVAISDEEVERFRKQLRRKRRFESIPLRARLNDDEVAAFAINRHRFPGVEVRARLIRHYPHGELTAHVIGYVGRINEEELIGLDATNYSATQHIGKIGVERSYVTGCTVGWATGAWRPMRRAACCASSIASLPSPGATSCSTSTCGCNRRPTRPSASSTAPLSPSTPTTARCSPSSPSPVTTPIPS